MVDNKSWLVLDTFMVKENEKVAVLVDGANSWQSGKNVGAFLDFPKIAQDLEEQCRLRAARYYTAILPNDEAGLNAFIARLGCYGGYNVVSKPATDTGSVGPGRWKGNMDIEMAMDLAELAVSSDVETFILFTGDRDFIPALEFVQRRGRRVIIVSTMNEDRGIPPDVATDLRKQASRFVDIAHIPHYHHIK